MEPAIQRLASALEQTNFYNARIPFYTNVTARPVTSKDEIRKLLLEQLNSPVRWEEIILNMIDDGIEEFYEIGPGKVLQGLIKRIDPNVKCFGIDSYNDVYKYF
jgi:[acyl-carrier-protein] S-malonyltransferase